MKKIFLALLLCAGTFLSGWAGEVEMKNIYYTWIDKVNVREKPSASGTVLQQLSLGEDVLYLGQKTKDTTTVTLQGKSYTDSWAKIQTRSGKTGWVHAAALNKKVFLYCWLENVNLRETPDLKGKVSGQIKEKENLTYLGYQTDILTEVSLRGKTYKEPWIKVETTQGVQGWVHAATVKNLILTPEQLAQKLVPTLKVGKNQVYKDLQSAINNAPDGAVIEIDPGQYISENNIEIKGKFNLILRGSTGSEIITSSKWSDVLSITESENITLENLTLRHDIPVDDYCSGMVINLFQVKDIKVLNCDVNGCGWLGIYGYRLDGLTVKDSYFHDNFEFAMAFDGEGKNILIENCRIDQNGGGVSPDWSQDIQSDSSPVSWIKLVNNYWGSNPRPGDVEYDQYGDYEEGGGYEEGEGEYYEGDGY